ncbi:hypothetical protein [Lacipirellula sp.]|uniref:hypothetical protein n=1 Tax=Lacipirellula sp. TaxID=2691419 RepID=UPI003D11F2AE
MQTIKRAELYRLVWSEPRRVLAAKLGISDVGIAKLCRRLDIPMPPRGYWAKKAVGKPVKVVKLPRPTADESVEYSPTFLSQAELSSGHTSEIDLYPHTGIGEEVENRIAAERRPESVVKVSDDLMDAHPFVAAESKRRAPLSKEACEQCIEVSKQQHRRTLLFLDALLKALSERGFEIVALGEVRLFGVAVEFIIRERKARASERDQFTSNTSDYSGKLKFQVVGTYDRNYSWTESRIKSLESQINEIIIGLTLVAAREHESEVEWTNRCEQDRELREAPERERKLFGEHAERVAELTRMAVQWKVANDIKDFIAAMEEKQAAGTLQWQSDVPFDAWVRWAKQEAVNLDPLERPFGPVESEQGDE